MKILKDWMDIATPDEEAALAKSAKTTVGNLVQIACGNRKPKAEFAIRLETAARKIRLKNRKLPILLREQMNDGCSICEFARRCR